MNTTRSTIKHQRENIKRFKVNNSSSYSFFNLLTSEKLFEKVEELHPLHRERLFPPTETLSMFLSQAMSDDRSCQNMVSRSAVQRLNNRLPMCSTRTGGYCRARKRLPTSMVVGLTQYLGREIECNTPEK